MGQALAEATVEAGEDWDTVYVVDRAAGPSSSSLGTATSRGRDVGTGSEIGCFVTRVTCTSSPSACLPRRTHSTETGDSALATGKLPKRRFGAVWILDQHRKGVERLAHLRKRHFAALKTEPAKPPQCRSLGALGFVLSDEEGDAQGVLEVDGRQARDLGADRGQVPSVKGLLEPLVRMNP